MDTNSIQSRPTHTITSQTAATTQLKIIAAAAVTMNDDNNIYHNGNTVDEHTNTGRYRNCSKFSGAKTAAAQWGEMMGLSGRPYCC